jgi:hypothetical protein
MSAPHDLDLSADRVSGRRKRRFLVELMTVEAGLEWSLWVDSYLRREASDDKVRP